MKKFTKFFAVALSLIMVLSCLTACGGGGGSDTGNNNYEPITFTFADNFEITITNDKVVYSEENETDAFVLEATIKNIASEDKDFQSYANMNAYQGDEYLSWDYISDMGDIAYYDDLDTIPAGESVNCYFSWLLLDPATDVDVKFMGYTDDTEDVEHTFAISGRTTAEWQAVLDAEAATKDTKEVDCTGFTLTVADGYYVDSVDEDKVTIKIADKENGLIDISTVSYHDAATSIADMADTFSVDPSEIKTVQAGGTEWTYFSTSETTFRMAADYSGDGANGQCVSVYGLGFTLDECLAQLELVNPK